MTTFPNVRLRTKHDLYAAVVSVDARIEQTEGVSLAEKAAQFLRLQPDPDKTLQITRADTRL